ncbi:GNAT family N-acetyltransferase [Candidatus Entotheonella palauensis]|uniref:GNAT family N-acetyltransferase n=1 Tax=Candidatus Entotheonella palauensis TaxID=93172 RepID=UPI000B80014B|nr:GNAT family N-acetyltransferase [Candidatus Entotheonella palauensis]
MMDRVETERLYLRRFEDTDRDAYYLGIYADPEVMKTLPAGQPIARGDFEARVTGLMVDHWREHGFGPWVVVHKADEALIGHCGLKYWPDSPDVEVFYALAKPYWGQGLATEGARASLCYGFELLGLDYIIAGAFVDNVASRRVLEKIGMTYTGEMTFSGLTVAGYMIRRRDYMAGQTVE